MKRDAAIATLTAHEAELKRLDIEHLYLFGATARGEVRDDSDVDLYQVCRKELSAVQARESAWCRDQRYARNDPNPRLGSDDADVARAS
jgi:Nucleotidyltransferase domain